MPFDACLHPTAANGARFSCAGCPSATSCVIRDASAAEVAAWSAALDAQVSLPYAGKVLFEAGSPADAVYSVRAGCLKSCTVDENGVERVRGFYLPGDLIGLDVLGSEEQHASVVAVLPSQVCRIPRARAMQLLAQAPGLFRRLLERTSRELAQALALAGDYTADQRIAAFLMTMHQRYGEPQSLKLPMTRRDIANYLRLATETVCRTLTRFQGKGVIVIEDKSLRIVDAAPLRRLAAVVGLDGTRAALAIAA